MADTYRDWARDVLRVLMDGQEPPIPERFEWLIAWAQLEDTEAQFNPLATTMSAPWATEFNTAGVKNYPTLSAGVSVAVQTLRLKGFGYGAIIDAFHDPSATFGHFRDAVSRSSWSGLPRDGEHYLVPDFDPSWLARELPLSPTDEPDEAEDEPEGGDG